MKKFSVFTVVTLTSICMSLGCKNKLQTTSKTSEDPSVEDVYLQYEKLLQERATEVLAVNQSMGLVFNSLKANTSLSSVSRGYDSKFSVYRSSCSLAPDPSAVGLGNKSEASVQQISNALARNPFVDVTPTISYGQFFNGGVFVLYPEPGTQYKKARVVEIADSDRLNSKSSELSHFISSGFAGYNQRQKKEKMPLNLINELSEFVKNCSNNWLNSNCMPKSNETDLTFSVAERLSDLRGDQVGNDGKPLQFRGLKIDRKIRGVSVFEEFYNFPSEAPKVSHNFKTIHGQYLLPSLILKRDFTSITQTDFGKAMFANSSGVIYCYLFKVGDRD